MDFVLHPCAHRRQFLNELFYSLALLFLSSTSRMYFFLRLFKYLAYNHLLQSSSLGCIVAELWPRAFNSMSTFSLQLVVIFAYLVILPLIGLFRGSPVQICIIRAFKHFTRRIFTNQNNVQGS